MDADSPSNPRIRKAGLILGPLLALAVGFVMPTGGVLGPGAAATAGVATLMAVWWITEAIPLAATALLPLALFPLLNVLPMPAIAKPYGDPIVFLFLGGFFIQQAMERWGLHKRIALGVMLMVGTRPGALIAGIMIATAFLSMWVSNAATAAMMLPIGLSVCQVIENTARADSGLGRGGAGSLLPVSSTTDRSTPGARNFGIAMMLGIAYASSIGGLGTPIGTAPNVIMLGALKTQFGLEISFGRWVLFAFPLVIILLAFTWFILVKVLYRSAPAHHADQRGASARTVIRQQWRELGPMRAGERAALGVFIAAALLWVTRQPLCEALGWVTISKDGRADAWLTDAGIAIIAGLSLFIIPVKWREGEFALNWAWASKIPFGVLLLFGGGFALAEAISTTKLDAAIANELGSLRGIHPLLLVFIVTAVTVFASELISNTALVLTFMPAVTAAAAALGVSPILLALPLTLGASTAFMLPAGTPPNAIVFSSGYLTVPIMARAGIFLNIFSIMAVTLMVYYLGPVLLGLSMSTP